MASEGENALLRWSGFPVDRRPRPVVLTGRSHWFGYDFRTDPHRTAEGDSHPDLPAAVSEVSARFGDVHTGAWLPVVRAVHRPAPFAADRGPRELPAWWLWRAGQNVPLVVLDPEARGQTWAPAGQPECPGFADVATVTGDGRTLIVPMPSAWEPERVLESRTAVTVPHHVRTRASGLVPIGFPARTVEVRLARPLGDRVLIDHVTAWPIAVMPGA